MTIAAASSSRCAKSWASVSPRFLRRRQPRQEPVLKTATGKGSSRRVYFSENYEEARSKFRAQVQKAGGQLYILELAARGPSGSSLSIDIGWFGSVTPQSAAAPLFGHPRSGRLCRLCHPASASRSTAPLHERTCSDPRSHPESIRHGLASTHERKQRRSQSELPRRRPVQRRSRRTTQT